MKAAASATTELKLVAVFSQRRAMRLRRLSLPTACSARARGELSSHDNRSPDRFRPYAWLKTTLEKIAAGHTNSRIDELLPWNLKPPSS